MDFFFSLLSFLMFLIYLSLIYYVYRKDENKFRKFAFVLFISTYAIWSLGYVFIFHTQDREILQIWYKISGFGWTLAPITVMVFIYSLTHSVDTWADKLKALGYLALWPLTLIPMLLGKSLASQFERTSLGWIETISPTNPWAILYALCAMVGFSLSMHWLIQWKKKLSQHKINMQVRLISITIMITGILAIISNIVLPVLNIERLPALAHIILGISAVAIGVSIIKYNFMSLSPGFVVDKIIDNITDLLFIMDSNGKITKINQYVQRILKFQHKDLIGQNIDLLFQDPSLFERLKKVWSERNEIVNFKDIPIITADHETISVNLYFSSIFDKFDDHIGYLIICEDIRHVKTLIRTMEELKMTQSNLKYSEERFRTMAEMLPEIIFEINLEGRFLFLNKISKKLMGITDEEMYERNIFNHFLPNDIPRLRSIMTSGFSGQESVVNEFSLKTADNGMIPVLVYTSPVLEEGKLSGFRGIIINNMHQKEIEEELKMMAMTDPLTRIYNRYKIMEDLEREVNRANRYHTTFSVILLDIDHFKRINDNYGHNIGDDILVKISGLVFNMIRVTDIFGRWGGEEFIIVCFETLVDGAQILADRIRMRIENQNFFPGLQVTASFGVSSYQIGDDVNQVIKKADQAMYQSKKTGRNCVTIDPSCRSNQV